MADRPEAAPADTTALVVSLYPEVYGGSSPGAQDVVGVNANDVGPSPDVLIRGIRATHHGGTISSVAPVAPGPGVVSGTAGAKAEPVSDTSSTVLVNGQPCVRNGSCYTMNDGNVLGQMTYEVGGPSNATPESMSPDATNPDLAAMTEIERYLADPDGYVPPAAPAGASTFAAPASPSFEDQWSAAQLARNREMMTHYAPEPVSPAAHHSAGFVKGLGSGLWDAATGTVEFAANASQYATDTVLAPIGAGVDYVTGGNAPNWLPSAARGQATSKAIVDTAGAIVDDPMLVWDALTMEVRDLWAAGEYGEAIGRSTAVVAEVLVGAKGATRARNLSRMDPEAVEALRREGLIDAEDIAEAEALKRADDAAEARTGEDGVRIEGERVPEEPFEPVGWTLEEALASGIKPAQLDDAARKAWEAAPDGTTFYGLYDTKTGRVAWVSAQDAQAGRAAVGPSASGHQGAGHLLGMPATYNNHTVQGFSAIKLADGPDVYYKSLSYNATERGAIDGLGTSDGTMMPGVASLLESELHNLAAPGITRPIGGPSMGGYDWIRSFPDAYR